MSQLFKIAIWNANGLSQHRMELTTFLTNHNIDILLISETHFTDKTYFQIKNYKIYDTKKPDGTAHGGSAILIKNNITHYELPKYSKEHIQATSISVADWNGTLTISALYCPPKHKLNKNHFLDYFQTLGNRFIAGGDYNAKHVHWGSRITTHKGRQLYLAMETDGLKSVSSGQPTYWPSDKNKIPDLIDFAIVKGFPSNNISAESCLDLSSDHSPIIIMLHAKFSYTIKAQKLHNKFTNWGKCRKTIDSKLSLQIPLKNAEQISAAVRNFNSVITQAVKDTTPQQKLNEQKVICSSQVKQKIDEKRKLRKIWQVTRAPKDKAKLNKAAKNLKKLLLQIKNETISNYLRNLSPSIQSDFSLWKATRKLNQPQKHYPPIKMNNNEWAISDVDKAQTFAVHLKNTFTPFPAVLNDTEYSTIYDFMDIPLQLSPPIKKFNIKEVQEILNSLNIKKSPGDDQIDGKILKELPNKAVRYLTYIFNAALKTAYFPSEWKVAQIILLPKPGKNPTLPGSYRPISLLPIVSKIFEKLLLKRLLAILNENHIIPDHQFGFRNEHTTTEQIHRVVQKIQSSLQQKEYCAAAFLDISQAFDKVWHTGLLYKLKSILPYHMYLILRSYISDRKFMVKHNGECSKINDIKSGVPQGSVLGPVLYIIFTADLPTNAQSTTATFADDTVIMASSTNPKDASSMLQKSLNEIQDWLKKWRMKANEGKSVQVTFTTRKETCPAVCLNNVVLPQSDSAKYLGLHLDRKLLWRTHILTKVNHLRTKLRNLYWLLGTKSQLSLENKILIYKCIIKPIWTYGIELWGTASKSNIEIIERFQSKTLRNIIRAPWYVKNSTILRDLNISTVKEEISKISTKYHVRLSNHPNQLVSHLLSANIHRRIKRFQPFDLQSRFTNA